MDGPKTPKRSQVGIDLIRLLAAEGDRIFSTDRARELSPQVGLKETYLLEALYHLRRTGWIVSLRRGLYAISPTVPGIPPAHEFEIAMVLVDPAAVSHWSALHYHGLTEQPPREVFVLTTSRASIPRMRGSKAGNSKNVYKIDKTPYRFVRVKPLRFFGVQQVWIGEARISITDPERTLIDALTMPQYCGDFAEVLHAFEARGPSLELDRIIHYALRMGPTTAKRLGWVLEHQGFEPSKLEKLAAIPIKGYRKLDPTGPRKGPCRRRWMIQENLPGKIKT